MTSTPANIGGRYASLSDAAEYIGVNEKTVRRRIADGTLIGYRLGGRLLRVDLNEVDQALRPIPTVKAG
jgi:excisionase family DNA binding protein